jgi:hypothetical protein
LDLNGKAIASTINYQSGTLSNMNTATATHVLDTATLNTNGLTIGGTTFVDKGGTLKGTGTVGALNVYGTLAPGNSPGITTAGDTLWATGGNYIWEVGTVSGTGTQSGAGTNFDVLNITSGNLTIQPGFTINVQGLTGNNTGDPAGNPSGWNGNNSYSWTIASVTGGGSIIGLNNLGAPVVSGFTGIPSGATWSLTAPNGKDLILNYMVPEPGTLGLLALGALALLGRRRRK